MQVNTAAHHISDYKGVNSEMAANTWQRRAHHCNSIVTDDRPVQTAATIVTQSRLKNHQLHPKPECTYYHIHHKCTDNMFK